MALKFSKLIDKAKPHNLFNQHHHKQEQEDNTKLTLRQKLTNTHLFGYKDDTRDSYVEPTPGQLMISLSILLPTNAEKNHPVVRQCYMLL